MNHRPAPENVGHVLVLGAGTIGASWTAYFTWRGLHVQIVDPNVSAESLATEVNRCLVALRQLGQPAQEGTFSHESNLGTEVREADFVQESVVENLAVKQHLLAKLESLLSTSTVICSSTSALMPTDIQTGCKHPERVLVGHPFNPPHLLPLVEVVAGQKTAPESVAWTMQFYQHIGKHAIQVKKEVKGHIANRLTSALFREAVHLLTEGIATAADVDAAITYGPGLRWALMGPFLTYHMGGGTAGIEGYLEHLGDSHTARWAQLGQPQLDEAARGAIIRSVLQTYGDLPREALSSHRDRGLLELLRLQQQYDQTLSQSPDPFPDCKT